MLGGACDPAVPAFFAPGSMVFFAPNKSTQHRAGAIKCRKKKFKYTMKKYLTGMKIKEDRERDNEANLSLPKAKTGTWIHCDCSGRRGKTDMFKNVGSRQH